MSSLNKVAFITGGANGIGRATVKKFIAENINVVFFDNNEKQGKQLTEELATEKCLFIPGDVRNINELNIAVEKTIQHFGHLDIMVPCAGIYCHKNAIKINETEWDEVIDINLKAVAFTVKAVLPHFIERNRGNIVLMGSDQSSIAKKNSFAYTISKGGITQMAKSLALDFAKYNIRVNAVCPGTVRTSLTETLINTAAAKNQQYTSAAIWEMINQEIPLGRYGQPEEIAELIYFLTSEKASFMTGSVVNIDGGFTVQ